MGKPLEVYQYLEPLFNDYRKIRERKLDGTFGLTHVDETVHDMLHSDHLFDVALPRIPHRCCSGCLPIVLARQRGCELLHGSVYCIACHALYAEVYDHHPGNNT